jgi:hypothetical protein
MKHLISPGKNVPVAVRVNVCQRLYLVDKAMNENRTLSSILLDLLLQDKDYKAFEKSFKKKAG